LRQLLAEEGEEEEEDEAGGETVGVALVETSA
jgi:hypothetical protein